MKLDRTAPPAATPPRADERLKQACRGFESLFLHTLLKEMRSTEAPAALEGSGPARDITRDLYDQALSEEMSRAGGLGVGPLLYRQLNRAQVPAPGADKESERRIHP
ncbi:MAG TPA: rod-binding protein [Elusimicrobiota bacterium]|nr:rod-binding protein [Elusimicrobiota bacterium]HMX42600.1 rod-binding protein [Elusimicrobiota bacterium]HMX93877.1 rod-binding protein [Elusimicrobiota bacterium]HND63557.1 rod-binding protein [Elusimicrobiota bacterium]HNI56955.1 rod-binding protein [Elusimicrobiota bacterium]